MNGPEPRPAELTQTPKHQKYLKVSPLTYIAKLWGKGGGYTIMHKIQTKANSMLYTTDY